jgi:LmbE family N-acetylglucosaminyl deacetylase
MTNLLLSPHSDDIAFSLGGALLQGQIPNATLATVFEYTSYIPYSEDENLSIDEVTNIRRAEDQAYAKQMGLVFTGLGLNDASQRGYVDWKELFNVRDYRQDAEATIIINAIHSFLNQQKNFTCLWVPLSIGNHIDHVLVHQAALQWWTESQQRQSQIEIMFYEDIPYAGTVELDEISDFIYQKIGLAVSQIIDISSAFPKKLNNLKFYASQVGSEDLDLVQKHADRIVPGKAVERVWRKQKANFS